MKIWLDAQISPVLARWLETRFDIQAQAVRDVGHHGSEDVEIFAAAKAADAVVMTKDSDFVRMVETRGAPPHVIWITCGNTSNQHLMSVLDRVFDEALRLIDRGEPVVEISDAAEADDT